MLLFMPHSLHVLALPQEHTSFLELFRRPSVLLISLLHPLIVRRAPRLENTLVHWKPLGLRISPHFDHLLTYLPTVDH